LSIFWFRFVKSPDKYINYNHNDYNIKSHVRSSHVSDFGDNKSKDADLISTIIHRVQAYTDSKLNNPGYITNEPMSECETMPAINMACYKDRFYSVSLFLEKNVIVTEQIIYQAEQLACLLAGLATHVFEIPINTMHLFQDIDGSENIYDD
jgi:hypothetical protein